MRSQGDRTGSFLNPTLGLKREADSILRMAWRRSCRLRIWPFASLGLYVEGPTVDQEAWLHNEAGGSVEYAIELVEQRTTRRIVPRRGYSA